MVKELDRECVARGANLLDRVFPGWYKNINLKTLNQISKKNCVIGQVFDCDYSSAFVNLKAQAMNRCGFMSIPEFRTSYGFDFIQPTEVEWEREITDRLWNKARVEYLSKIEDTTLTETLPNTSKDDAFLLDAARRGVVDLFLACTGRPESDRALVTAAIEAPLTACNP